MLRFKKFIKEKKEDPCWKGYKQVGMKKKKGKKVPNCVPVSEEYKKYKNDDRDTVSHVYSHNIAGKQINVSFLHHKDKPEKQLVDFKVDGQLSSDPRNKTHPAQVAKILKHVSSTVKNHVQNHGVKELSWTALDRNPKTIEAKRNTYKKLASRIDKRLNPELNDQGFVPVHSMKVAESIASRKTEDGAGMTQSDVDKYKRQNPGSKLQTAVTEKNPKGKRASRRKSFCARMKGVVQNSKGDAERAKASLKRWNCN